MNDISVADAVQFAGSSFGPELQLQAIEVVGNEANDAALIAAGTELQPGMRMHAGDPRLGRARYRLLAMGFFREVELALRRGTAPGTVIIVVHVVERSTLTLNRLWFGASPLAPWWAGADVSERNLFGTGWAVGLGVIGVAHATNAQGAAEVPGARSQGGLEVRVGRAGLAGAKFGGYLAATVLRGSEALRVRGEAQASTPSDFLAFDVDRVALRLGATYDLSARTRLRLELAGSRYETTAPLAPVRVLPDNSSWPVVVGLMAGRSYDSAVVLGFEQDTRDDAVLPSRGWFWAGSLKTGALASYAYAALGLRAEAWWPLGAGHHALGVRGGLHGVVGTPPRFERVEVASVNRMAVPRAMGLMVSASTPISLLGTNPDKPLWGDIGGSLAFEYSRKMFRRAGSVFGGDVFVGAGVWGLYDRYAPPIGRSWATLPIDMFIDAGMRIDTDVGVFELTLANALGRVPL